MGRGDLTASLPDLKEFLALPPPMIFGKFLNPPPPPHLAEDFSASKFK